MTSTDPDYDAKLRLAAGRAKASELMPYLSTALFAMQPVMTREIPTFGVDKRWRMYWNPEFCRTMSVAECAGVWLHEAGHLLRDHRARFDALLEPKERHPLWNMAGDAAINDDLRTADVPLPLIKAYYPERIPGANPAMTTEQMYRLLLDTPAADRVSRQKADLVLVPSQIRYDDHTPRNIIGFTRRGILDATATVTVLDGEGTPMTGVHGPLRTHDRRTLDFDLTTALDSGEYVVRVTRGTDTADGLLRVTYPAITLRPDHVASGYTAPFKVVVAGNDTRFTDTSVVEVTDAEGNPVTGAVVATEHVSATYLTFDLGVVADGLYTVTVHCGAETVTAALPVGLPYLDLSPASLPSGHGTPYPIAGVSDDFTFGPDTTVEVLDPALSFAPVPAATGNLAVVSPTVVNFSVTEPLHDGPFLVVATSGGVSAVANLTVGQSQGDGQGEGGGEGDGEGEGDGQGQGQGQGDSESGGKGGGKGDGKGGGKGQGDSQGGDNADDADLPDCGSGAGGGRRPWEADDSETNDGSVDEGRGNLIREQTAREIREASKGRGTVPGGWLRWAETVLDPQVDWRRELRSVVRRTAATVAGMRDYTYSRPSRRTHAVRNVILPAMRAPRPPQCAVVIDTSGSVSDTMIGQALGDIKGLLKTINAGGGDHVKVIACDASAAEMQSVANVEKITLAGGGGTDMRVGIEAAAKILPRVDLIVTMTDGETPWPVEPPAANPRARYAAVLLNGECTYSQVPSWMHKIVVNTDYLTAR